MVIRRSDTRRRRVGVLIDEGAPAPDVEEVVMTEEVVEDIKTVESSPGVACEYSASARRRHLAKTTDLIPKRWITVALVVLALFSSIGLINLLYLSTAEMTSVLGERAEEVFSLSARGSLSQWFTTILLIVSGMASLQIYALRQHRSNDYRGTYKLWFWLAILLLFASLDSAVGLHELAINATNFLTGLALSHSGWALIAIKLVLLSILIGRGVVEVRKSTTAIVGVALVWLAYAGSILLQLPQAQEQLGGDQELYYGNMFLVGNVVLLLSILGYARFVYLSAQGLIVPATAESKATESNVAKRSKTKLKRTKKSSAQGVESAADESAPTTTQGKTRAKSKTTPVGSSESTKKVSKSKSKRKSTKSQPVVESQEQATKNEPESSKSVNEEPTVASLPLGEKLSKSQRRKLRKAQKQQQRRAA